MANILGQITVDAVLVLEVDADPSAGGGTTAPLGSFSTITSGGGMYIKTSAPDTGWTKISMADTTVVGPASATDNAIARFDGTTGKLIKNSSVTLDNTGMQTMFKQGDQFQISQDASLFREGSWNLTTAGTLYTTLGNELAMKYQSHNTALDASGNFLGRDEAADCQLVAWTESGKLKHYYAPTAAAGVVPTFSGVYQLDLAAAKHSSFANTYSLETSVVDSTSTIAFKLNTTNQISLAGSRVLSIQNNSTEIVSIFGAASSVGGSFGVNTVTGGFAFGNSNTAAGSYGTAMGFGNSVSGNGATAMGLSNTAVGLYSTAIGFGNTASGFGGVSLGVSNKALSSNTAFLIGSGVQSTGNNAIIIGTSLTSTSGTAVGSFATNSQFSMGGLQFGYGQSFPGMYQGRTRGVTFHDTNRMFVGESGTLSGVELVTNGTFTGSLTGWGTTGTSWSYGTNNATNSGAAAGDTLTQTITGLVVGAVYRLSFDIGGSGTYATTGITPSLATSSISFNKRSMALTGVRELFVARSTSEVLTFTADGAGGVITLDNVSIQEVIAGDLSIPGNAYFDGTFSQKISTTTSSLTLGRHGVLLADSTSSAITITLPSAIGINGRIYTIKRINLGPNNVTINTTSSQTIDGGLTAILNTQYQSITVISDGANWLII